MNIFLTLRKEFKENQMREDYLRGLNAREEGAWKAFYDEYYSALCAYACKFVGNAEDAEDVVQETCVRVWESNRVFATMKECAWYVYKAVYTNSLLRARTKSRRERLLREMPVEEVEMPEEAFAEAVREELGRQLRKCIGELPEEARKILELSLEGLSGNEIAGKLGISIHTVKSQKNRSFKFLREKLSGTYYLSLLWLLLPDFF